MRVSVLGAFLHEYDDPMSFNPFGAPKSTPTLIPSNYVPNPGFPVVKGVTFRPERHQVPWM